MGSTMCSDPHALGWIFAILLWFVGGVMAGWRLRARSVAPKSEGGKDA